jgi:diguanylate cyclase (GGDEF)-like protein/PAS domain S-box-containing protein
MVIKKLLAVRKADSQLPQEVKAALVDSLYAPFASLIFGAACGGIISAMVAYRANDPWLSACSLAICLVGIGRIASVLAYRWRSDGPFAERVHRWERVFKIGAWSYAVLLGFLGFVAVLRTADGSLHLVVTTTVAGYAAGISGRNAGRPIVAVGQIALSHVPLSIALFAYGEVLYGVMGLVVLLFAHMMSDIVLSIRDVVVQALVTTRDKAALATRFEDQAQRFDVALNNMSHGLCMFDRDNRLVVWNERFLTLFGLPESAVVIGARFVDLLRLSIKLGNHPEQGVRRLWTELRRLSAGEIEQVVMPLKGERWIALSRRSMADGGSVVIFEDVTERKQAEERIARMARYDELTGLPNRNLFRERIGEGLAGLKRRCCVLAMHLIDLDRFKSVNDTLGHPVGDRLLHAIGGRLQSAIRKGDMVARLGGDEFVVLQSRLAGTEEAAKTAQRLVEALSLPLNIDGHRVHISASVGIAVAPRDGADADELLKNADMALYAAKADGRGIFRFFEPAMDAAAQERRTLEMDLRNALGRGEMDVHFQPLIDLESNRISACEALLRWRHPERGTISPADFIPVAEETGLIVQLGEWVLNRACAEAIRWPASVRVAVNLSPAQFKDGSLTSSVITALARSGLSPDRLELEITETVLLQDSDATMKAMRQLQQLGVRMSLDDFGIGYSSLSYLRKFPFSKIKIDGSFVKDLASDSGAIAIIRAVTSMGADLGMDIVVEGVETEEQLRMLEAEGCREAQGYFLGRPMPAEAIKRRMAEPANARKVA